MLGLLPALLEKFGSKSAIYEAVESAPAFSRPRVRRYFFDSDRLRAAPLAVYRAAKDLADTPQERASERSYLADERTRQVAPRSTSAASCQRSCRRTWSRSD